MIFTEAFDSVTAPARPSGWNFDAVLVTSASLLGGITPTSSPNVLTTNAPGDESHYYGTYGSPDIVGGDVTVSVRTNAVSTSHPQSVGLMARGSTSNLGTGSPTYYWARFDIFTLGIVLYKVVSGTPTSLGSVTAASVTLPEWYTPEFALTGTTLEVFLSRASDGNYVNSLGAWTASPVPAISLTDSAISGSGYTGLTIQSRGGTTYADDWVLDGAAAPLTYALTSRRRIAGEPPRRARRIS
jgi:hypothetical protein